MKTFLITGGNLVNKGAQAMLFVTVSEIRERFPDAVIYYTTHESEGGSEKNYKLCYMYKYSLINALGRTSGLLSGPDYYHAKIEQIGKCLVKKNFYNVFSQMRYEHIIDQIDVLIDISGYNLSSQWPLRISKNYLNTIKYAHACGIAIYLMPQSFGPFDYNGNQEEMDQEIAEVLSYAKIIFAREEDGYSLLVNKYGLTNVKLSYDLVLQNKQINWENVFKESYCPKKKFTISGDNNVGIVPNIRSYQNMQDGMIIALYEDIINLLLKLNKHVYLIYHSKEDVSLCKKINTKYKNNPNVTFVKEELDCYEYEEIVETLDFVIASRFHSIIHAYKKNIPCVVLGWAQKYHDLLKEFQQSEYLFDVRDQLSFNDIEKAILFLNNNLTCEKNKLIKNLERIQKQNCFESIFETMNS